jgi:hypothetical protein
LAYALIRRFVQVCRWPVVRAVQWALSEFWGSGDGEKNVPEAQGQAKTVVKFRVAKAAKQAGSRGKEVVAFFLGGPCVRLRQFSPASCLF